MEAKKVISHFFLSLRRLICFNLQYSDELNFIGIFLLTSLSISGEFVEVLFQNVISLSIQKILHYTLACFWLCLRAFTIFIGVVGLAVCASGWSQSPGPHYCSQPSCQWSSGSQADTQLVPGLSTQAGKLSIHCSGSTTEHECCQKICHPFIASVQTGGNEWDGESIVRDQHQDTRPSGSFSQ